MSLIAKLIWSPYGPDGAFLPDIAGSPPQSGAAVTAGRFVVISGTDGSYSHVADNGEAVSALAMSSASGSAADIRLKPVLPGEIYAVAVNGSPSATDIGAKFGIDTNGKLEIANTTQLLFTLLAYDDDWAYVSFGADKITTPGGSSAV
jgi:hypothetical protein